jgi:glyoxylase-like metal-dependent hydrolase (beta-lactamase superfamily II)
VCDPHLEHVDEYLRLAEAAGAGIGHVFETHVQADHRSGALELARRAGARVYLHEAADVSFPHVDVGDGDEIQLGNDYVRVLHRVTWTTRRRSTARARCGSWSRSSSRCRSRR